MTQAYSDPKREDDPHALPNVEVFHIDENNPAWIGYDEEYSVTVNGSYLEPGWYYWVCFPGCLPDSDPIGPFATEEEAIADAQEDALEYDDLEESSARL